jgi:NADH-quinone oxidoreductase subunit K
MIPIEHYLALSFALFLIGAGGALLRRNPVIILMSIALMLTAVNANLIAFSRLWGTVHGQLFSLFIMADGAVETALGLGIVVSYSRTRIESRDRGDAGEPKADESVYQPSDPDIERSEIPVERPVR